MFTILKDKPVCLVCGASVSVIKEYNIRQHYETKHQDKCKDLNKNQKLQKVEKMKRSLVLQQTVFTKAKSQSEAAVKANFMWSQRSPNQPGRLMKENLLKSAC